MDFNEQTIYDIGIIGAGPAGMTAAIYAGRANKTVVILDKAGFGGQIAESPKVENFPGFASISGAELTNLMFDQMTKSKYINYQLAEVIYTSYCKGLIKITTAERNLFFCRSLIIATGAEHKKLQLDKNTKTGIFLCVVCDGPFMKGKDVLVVGSGNSGGQYALELASYCNHVYICDITADMCCEADLKNKILKAENITWIPQKTVSQCKYKNGEMTSVLFKDGSKIDCQGVFVAIGQTPNTKKFSHLVAVDGAGYIIADEECKTNIPGIFVAGDCRTKKVRQAVTAANDGAVAALAAIKYISSK